mmetsp:Transcript_33118/g.51349  ORF Transcript_33118/g.51349 Transcript_33118/m.51349 type:complete len:200 (+) Transcript_33118:188-787(+)
MTSSPASWLSWKAAMTCQSTSATPRSTPSDSLQRSSTRRPTPTARSRTCPRQPTTRSSASLTSLWPRARSAGSRGWRWRRGCATPSSTSSRSSARTERSPRRAQASLQRLPSGGMSNGRENTLASACCSSSPQSRAVYMPLALGQPPRCQSRALAHVAWPRVRERDSACSHRGARAWRQRSGARLPTSRQDLRIKMPFQ